jgi:hypothetical protein
MLAKEAKTQARQNAALGREEDAQARIATARKIDAGFGARLLDSAKAGQPPDPNIALDALKEVAAGRYPLAAAREVGAMVHAPDMQPGAMVQGNQKVANDLFEKFLLPPGDPNRPSTLDIEKAVYAGKTGDPNGINREQANELHQEDDRMMHDPTYTKNMQLFNQVAGDLAKTFNPVDPDSSQHLPGQSVAIDGYTAAKRREFSMRVMGGEDPFRMMDPKSSTFLFSDASDKIGQTPEAIRKFIANEFMGHNKDVEPTRQPGSPLNSPPSAIPVPGSTEETAHFKQAGMSDAQIKWVQDHRSKAAPKTPNQYELDTGNK